MAKDTPAAPKPDARPINQLTRNVGRHLKGQTFRGTPQDMEAQGFKPDDYKPLGEVTDRAIHQPQR